MPKFIRDTKVEPMAKKLLGLYPEEFGFIDPEDVYVVRDIFAMRHKKIATIGLIDSKYEPFFPNKGLLIVIRDCNWRKYPKNTRKLILYHEFMHVEMETSEKRVEAGYKYNIIDHDMKEFYALVSTYGAKWLLRDDLPDIFKKKVKIKGSVEEYPDL
jgi:hypothetical protein